MSILNYFPFNPRPSQKHILEQIERNFNNYDVFVVVSPTAYGKEAIGTSIINWHGAGTFLVPNNLLVSQVARNNPDFTTMRNKASYKHTVAYNQARRSLKGGKCVLNYYQYLANRAYNEVLVLDEGHNMVDHLSAFGSIKLWSHLDGFEAGQFKTTVDLLEWLECNKGKSLRIDKALKALSGDLDKYIIEELTTSYRNKMQDCLLIKPLTPRDLRSFHWPSSVKKIVILSATFNDEDLYDLGLDKRRVFKIEGESPIPMDRRPITYWPLGSMGFKHQQYTLPKVAEWVSQALEVHPEKGVLHATYGVSAKLRKYIDNDRVLFHDQRNKDEVFNEWIKSDNKVLVACGMYEGISLNEDLARWQAILKAPFPNLTEPAINAKMKVRPDSYQWAAIKQIVQATGRVCRTPTDYGLTYILDSNVGRLIENNKHLVPQFWLDGWEKR